MGSQIVNHHLQMASDCKTHKVSVLQTGLYLDWNPLISVQVAAGAATTHVQSCGSATGTAMGAGSFAVDQRHGITAHIHSIFPHTVLQGYFLFAAQDTLKVFPQNRHQLKQQCRVLCSPPLLHPQGPYVIPEIKPLGAHEQFANYFQGNEDFLLCSPCAGWADDVQLEAALCSSTVRRIPANDLNEHWIKLMAKSSPYAKIHGFLLKCFFPSEISGSCMRTSKGRFSSCL